MGNIIQIKRGLNTPEDGDLQPYELGYVSLFKLEEEGHIGISDNDDPNAGSLYIGVPYNTPGGQIAVSPIKIFAGHAETANRLTGINGKVIAGDINTKDIAENSIAIGFQKTAGIKTTNHSIAIGFGEIENALQADGSYSIAMGLGSQSHGQYSVAIGHKAITSGINYEGAVAIGRACKAQGTAAVALGSAKALAEAAFAAGNTLNQAQGECSIALGASCTAIESFSLAVGHRCVTEAKKSSAIGYYCQTSPGNENIGQCVVGRNNQSDTAAFIVGNGDKWESETNASNASNAFVVSWDGAISYGTTASTSSADYAEMFEWQDLNPNSEDRVGYVVAINKEKVHFAQPEDKVFGIVSGTAAVIGDAAPMNWNNRYETDEFGRVIYVTEEIQVCEPSADPDKEPEIFTVMDTHPKQNPNYDPEQPYVPRTERPEWATVGLMGKLHVRDDGTCEPGSYAKVLKDGIVTKSEEPTNMYVMKRISESVVWVFLK